MNNFVKDLVVEVEFLARNFDLADIAEIEERITRVQTALNAVRSALGKPKLTSEVWARIARDNYALADALATHYATREAAMELARRTGCPSSSLHWANQPRVFWSKIVDDYANGLVPGGIERLKTEGFEPPEQSGLSDVEIAIIDELSSVYSEYNQARVMLQRAKFPVSQLPAFPTPAVFWTQVITTVSNGGFVSLRDILTQANRDLPGNRKITRLLAMC